MTYKKFCDIYKELKKLFGEIFMIELLSWRLHKDVLNFEEEGNSNFQSLSDLISKEKILINEFKDEGGKLN